MAPPCPEMNTILSPLLTIFLSKASYSTFCSRVPELTREPTIMENVPACKRVVLAAHSFGVTTSTGHRGLCLARIDAVLPEWVKARMRLAYKS